MVKILIRIVVWFVLPCLIISIFLHVYNKRSYKNTLAVDGCNFKFNIYNVKNGEIYFSRSDKNPEIFKRYEWLPAATVSQGGLFLEDWSDDKLKSLFEAPSEHPSKYVPELLSRIDTRSTINVVSVIKIDALNEKFLYVGLKSSNLPDYVLYSLLKNIRGRWVRPSSDFYPVDNFTEKVNKLQSQVSKDVKLEKFIYNSISEF
jgi:hypothetical protein